MGAPKPWPTRWPEPYRLPLPEDDDEVRRPVRETDREIQVDPHEVPLRLPEDLLRPYSVTWGVTHRCNLRCDHCYDAATRERIELPTARAVEVVDRLGEMGLTFIAFSGGEPLLYQHLFQLMEYCCSKGMGIALRSNGTLITRDTACRLADLGVQVVGVSVDGVTEATHELVRGQGTYRRMRDGVQALLAHGIRVNLEVVLRRRNVEQALEFIALAENWGVDEVNFAAIMPQGRGAELQNELLSHSAWKSITAKLIRASKTSSVAVSPSCTLLGDCWACLEPNVTCDGWVTPCYLSGLRLFHVLDTDPARALARLKERRLCTISSCGRLPWSGLETRVGQPIQLVPASASHAERLFPAGASLTIVQSEAQSF
jgi:MoaA/NifB/PqqE/SkfB family radical SAM enzyme